VTGASSLKIVFIIIIIIIIITPHFLRNKSQEEGILAHFLLDFKSLCNTKLTHLFRMGLALVLNRVYNFARVCPNYKQGIACPKQGNKIERVVLNRVCILGFFFSKQGQGFKPSAAHLYPNMGRVPPRDPKEVQRIVRRTSMLIQKTSV